MALKFLSYGESSLNIEKFRKNPKKSNLKSFWAFLLSIFIYISVFYVFNLSPSTLLCTTRFWFFISNTLILIIAADFGAFTSSQERDFYEDYLKNSVRTNVSPSYDTKYKKIVQETAANSEPIKEKPREKIIGVVVHAAAVPNQENQPEISSSKEERVLDDENPNDEPEKKKKEIIRFTLGTGDGKPVESEKMKSKCAHSNSDRATLMSAAAETEERMALHRTSSERFDEPRCEEINNDQYSSMSDEELNRRVEEFIRRFNRQIRLQAIRNRRHELELSSAGV